MSIVINSKYQPGKRYQQGPTLGAPHPREALLTSGVGSLAAEASCKCPGPPDATSEIDPAWPWSWSPGENPSHSEEI